MPNGRLTRRTRPRIARGFALLCVTLAAGAGCQRFPLRYAEVTPESTSKATTRVEHNSGPHAALAPFLATPPDALPPDDAPRQDPSAKIDAAPDPKEAKAGPGPGGASSATPLIDQALKRASGVADPKVGDPAPADVPVELPPEPENEPAASPPEGAGQVKPAAVSEPGPAPETAVIPKEFEPAPGAKPDGPEPEARDDMVTPAGLKASQDSPGAKPEPKRIDMETPADPSATRDEWREGLSRVRELALQRAGEPGDAAQAWAIRSRVLDWLAGEGPEPAGETGRVWNSVLATLATATGPETPDEPTLAYHLGVAVDALEAYAPIQITALNFCRKIDGFGHYDPVESPAVRPGQPLLVYCEMAGLRYESDDSGFRSRLSSQVEVLPAGGGKVVWSEALGTAEDQCRRRRRDYFVNYRLVVPARLAPGSYSLRLSQTDLVSNRSVTAAVPFSVLP